MATVAISGRRRFRKSSYTKIICWSQIANSQSYENWKHARRRFGDRGKENKNMVAALRENREIPEEKDWSGNNKM